MKKHKPNPKGLAPRQPQEQTVQLAPWILVSFKRIVNEMNAVHKYCMEKYNAFTALEDHVAKGTFPPWYKRTVFKPKVSAKFTVDVVNWDEINLNHDKLVISSLRDQYKAEYELANTRNKLDSYLELFQKEVEESAEAIFYEGEGPAKTIAAEVKIQMEQEIEAGRRELRNLYNKRLYKSRLELIEKQRKALLDEQKRLQAQDRMEDTEITPDIKKLIERMVQVKIKQEAKKLIPAPKKKVTFAAPSKPRPKGKKPPSRPHTPPPKPGRRSPSPSPGRNQKKKPPPPNGSKPKKGNFSFNKRGSNCSFFPKN